MRRAKQTTKLQQKAAISKPVLKARQKRKQDSKKWEIQQAVVGLQSLCKASTGQPKVNTIQTKIYRKSSVQGFASNLTKARQKRKQESKKWQYNKQLSGCEAVAAKKTKPTIKPPAARHTNLGWL